MRLASLAVLASVGLLLGLAGCEPKPADNAAKPAETSATTTTPPAQPVATETAPKATEPPKVPEMSVADMEKKIAVIKTSVGTIEIEFLPEKAPKHVANFIDLAEKKFYDGTRFHRVIEGFMIQGGDPNSKDKAMASAWGTGGYVVDGVERTIPSEFNDTKHERGIVSMARSSDPNSASSQFFIMHAASPSLDNQYSAFGRVIKGIDVVDKVVAASKPLGGNGEVQPDKAVVIESITIKDR